jgi:hypothetical protein
MRRTVPKRGDAGAPSARPSERWLSGRKRRFAKSVTGYPLVRRFESCPLRFVCRRPTQALENQALSSGVFRLAQSLWRSGLRIKSTSTRLINGSIGRSTTAAWNLCARWRPEERRIVHVGPLRSGPISECDIESRSLNKPGTRGRTAFPHSQLSTSESRPS